MAAHERLLYQRHIAHAFHMLCHSHKVFSFGEVDKLWESGQWDNEKNEAVLQEHLRTPYNVKH